MAVTHISMHANMSVCGECSSDLALLGNLFLDALLLSFCVLCNLSFGKSDKTLLHWSV